MTVSATTEELGQGVWTALAMLVAEELEAEWSRVRVEALVLNEASAEAIPEVWRTSRSDSVRRAWIPMRAAGAAARMMLIAAAAARWGVAPEDCFARLGEVLHGPTGRRLGFGELAAEAAAQDVPRNPPLKSPEEFRLIGRPTPRLDAAPKVGGGSVFGVDVRLPDLLTAVVARSPVIGGRPLRWDAAGSAKVGGVRGVWPLATGIAVVADSFFSAQRGRDALDVAWEEPATPPVESAAIETAMRVAVAVPGVTVWSRGLSGGRVAGTRVEADYWTPFLPHATLEPMSCVADVREGRCVVWVPTQAPSAVRAAAAEASGLSLGSVEVRRTFVGGSFGRRLKTDPVSEAVALSRAAGTPIKVLWTREDDLRHDTFRPATCQRLWADLDEGGMPVFLGHRVVAPPVRRPGDPMAGERDHQFATEGALPLLYAVPAAAVEWSRFDPPLPVGPWRSVGHFHTAFATESFLDEVAARGGHDPLELRRRLLPETSRLRGVIEVAAREAQWGSPSPPDRFRGLAAHAMAGSFAAQVAEVSVLPQGEIRVHRVVCAVDCGTVVNPSGAEAQIGGAVVFGLTAVLKGEISVTSGRIQETGFSDYPLLRMSEIPRIEVHLVSSRQTPSGVGEIGVPPVAPAVANAVCRATGQRLRRLPLRPESPSQR